jgi:hypothetical protein
VVPVYCSNRIEHVLLSPTGGNVWLGTHGQAQRDSAGNVLLYAGQQAVKRNADTVRNEKAPRSGKRRNSLPQSSFGETVLRAHFLHAGWAYSCPVCADPVMNHRGQKTEWTQKQRRGFLRVSKLSPVTRSNGALRRTPPQRVRRAEREKHNFCGRRRSLPAGNQLHADRTPPGFRDDPTRMNFVPGRVQGSGFTLREPRVIHCWLGLAKISRWVRPKPEIRARQESGQQRVGPTSSRVRAQSRWTDVTLSLPLARPSG